MLARVRAPPNCWSYTLGLYDQRPPCKIMEATPTCFYHCDTTTGATCFFAADSHSRYCTLFEMCPHSHGLDELIWRSCDRLMRALALSWARLRRWLWRLWRPTPGHLLDDKVDHRRSPFCLSGGRSDLSTSVQVHTVKCSIRTWQIRLALDGKEMECHFCVHVNDDDDDDVN